MESRTEIREVSTKGVYQATTTGYKEGTEDKVFRNAGPTELIWQRSRRSSVTIVERKDTSHSNVRTVHKEECRGEDADLEVAEAVETVAVFTQIVDDLAHQAVVLVTTGTGVRVLMATVISVERRGIECHSAHIYNDFGPLHYNLNNSNSKVYSSR